MLGLGETTAEIRQTLKDIRLSGCSIVTIGQYLQPTEKHLPVERFVPPEEFDTWRKEALEHRIRRSGQRTVRAQFVSCQSTVSSHDWVRLDFIPQRGR
jgi:lipoate synthase